MVFPKFFKGSPSYYIIKYVSGKIKKRGYGISFYYFRYNTTILSIPATTQDLHFVFNEISKNHQEVTLQGHLTYRIKDPELMAKLLNFQIDPKTGDYLTDDPEKLELRIKTITQMVTRKIVRNMTLNEILSVTTEFDDSVLNDVKSLPILQEMGVEVLSISFTSIRPKPEISRALEAEYRESLLRAADEAIYTRRAAAVEQERKIKENELATKIALEERNKELIKLRGENLIDEAEYEAQAESMRLKLFENLDPRLVLALSMREFALRADRIETLTITSEILSSILAERRN